MKTPSELRDYFAAKALEGRFSNDSLYRSIFMNAGHDTRDKEKDTYEDYIAQQCYKMADAMMKERKILLNDYTP